MKKRTIIAFVLLLLIIVFILRMLHTDLPAFSNFGRFPDATLVIDPGHGGEDGGAISNAGTVESDLNLAIALRLDALMGLYGVQTVMTRSEDISIHDSSATTLREKKISDLHNRVKMISEIENATLISIHQNSYPDPKYRGMQVFYANGPLSLPLAERTQSTAKLLLDPDNSRKPMKIAKSVYLMNHITCRAVLIECGFLSNPQEDRLLQEDTHQLKIAVTLAASYLNFQSEEEGENNYEGQNCLLLHGMWE